MDELLQLRGFLRRQRHLWGRRLAALLPASGAPQPAPQCQSRLRRAGAPAWLHAAPGGARRRVRTGAGWEPRQRRRSTVAFKRRGLPGLGLPPFLPDRLRLPHPSLGVRIPRAQRSPPSCPASVSAGTARPHLSPRRGPFAPCGRAEIWTDPLGPHAERLGGPRPPRPAPPPSLGALGTPTHLRGAAFAVSLFGDLRFYRRRARPVLPHLCDHVRSLRRIGPRPRGLHLPNGESPLSRAPRAGLGGLPLERFLRWLATASQGVSPALGQRAVLLSQVFSLHCRQVVAGCGAISIRF